MTLVTVAQAEQKNSDRGGFLRACVVKPDGSRVWASVFRKELQPLMTVGRQLDVELATSGDRGQFTDIVAAAPVGQDPQDPASVAKAPVPAPDATADRIYRCTALNAAVALAGGSWDMGTVQEEDVRQELITAVLVTAEAFNEWLRGGRTDGAPF